MKSEIPDPLDDVFSFGILMLEVGTGLTGVDFIKEVYPVEVTAVEDIVRFHAEGRRPNVPAAVEKSCGSAYVSIMRKCWSHDVLKRPVSLQVANILTKLLP